MTEQNGIPETDRIPPDAECPETDSPEAGAQDAARSRRVEDAIYRRARGYKVTVRKTYKVKRVEYDPETGKKTCKGTLCKTENYRTRSVHCQKGRCVSRKKNSRTEDKSKPRSRTGSVKGRTDHNRQKHQRNRKDSKTDSPSHKLEHDDYGGHKAESRKGFCVYFFHKITCCCSLRIQRNLFASAFAHCYIIDILPTAA